MRALSLFMIGLVLGGGLGFLVAVSGSVKVDGHRHDHAEPGRGEIVWTGHDHATHDHARVVDLPPGPDAPTVSLIAVADPDAGWNLHITTRNFRFAPDRASQVAVPGEGHAHLHVNGKKMARLYGPWFHLSAAQPGDRVTVTLNGNDHSGLSVGGRPVEASVILAR